MSVAFVESILSTACRREVTQNTVKTKLRGKRLLLEHGAHTVAPGAELARKRRKTVKRATNGPPPPNRARRREMLLEAAAQVTFEQLQKQHSAWLEYAEEELRRVPADRRPTLVSQIDWHGARVRVVRSTSAAHASCHGLVLTETRRMLLLLNETRRAWVPKAGTSIEVTLPTGAGASCGGVATCEAERPYPPTQEAV